MPRSVPPSSRARRRRGLAAAATLACAAALLSACSGESGKPTLNWYINPDGQEPLTAIAERCSTDEYDIEIQLLPASATDQRTQLARRLAAEDSSTDLMSLDPVFVAEFADAGWLLELPEEVAQAVTEGVLEGPVDTVTWEDKVFAAPQWANVQVLWYRKSLAEKAGLDMSEPVTWEQVIDAAAENNGSVGVQASRYEGYVVWLNALIAGAGGQIVSETEAGREAKVELDSEAGQAAAEVVSQLADSEAAQDDLSNSNEGTSLGRMFPADPEAPQGAGEFMVNWTFVYKNYEGLVGEDAGQISEDQFKDLGWARYPQTVEGEESRPPLGGIDIGVGAYTEHPDLALEAAQCVTDAEAQKQLALEAGFMPVREEVYDDEELQDAYDPSLLTLFQESIDASGPRPKSAYYSLISGAVQQVWHSPESVDPESTPEESATYLRDVLDGKSLL